MLRRVLSPRLYPMVVVHVAQTALLSGHPIVEESGERRKTVIHRFVKNDGIRRLYPRVIPCLIQEFSGWI